MLFGSQEVYQLFVTTDVLGSKHKILATQNKTHILFTNMPIGWVVLVIWACELVN